MLVIFRRTGQRQYAIEARRPRFGAVEMNPAPGYDELMPHDLLHLVVEAQLGLTHGIFGQLAAGGHAGTFRSYVGPSKSTRDAARRQRHLDVRGKKLLRAGHDESLQSERATFICWQAWLARSEAKTRRKTAQTMTAQAKQVRSIASGKEMRALSEQKLEQICRHLDELTSHWSQLKIGESMIVNWPDLSVSSFADGE